MHWDFPAQATVAAELQPVFQLESRQADQAEKTLLHEHQAQNNLTCEFFVCLRFAVLGSLFFVGCRDTDRHKLRQGEINISACREVFRLKK